MNNKRYLVAVDVDTSHIRTGYSTKLKGIINHYAETLNIANFSPLDIKFCYKNSVIRH